MIRAELAQGGKLQTPGEGSVCPAGRLPLGLQPSLHRPGPPGSVLAPAHFRWAALAKPTASPPRGA